MSRGVAGSDPGDAEVARWDAEGVRLSRSRGWTRLRMGEAFEALGDRFRELGFPSFAAYVRERTSLKPRYCTESRSLARRVADLPRLRGAIRTQGLPWSVAVEVSRHATAEDEEELVEACRGEAVRAVRRLLRDRTGDGGGGASGQQDAEEKDEPEVRYAPIELSGTVEEMLALEATRLSIEHMNAGPGEPGHWLECLLSEGHVELLARVGDLDPLMADVAERHRRWVEARRASEERNVEAEEAATPAAVPEVAVELPEDEPLPSDPVALDRVIRQLARELSSRDVWLGKLLERLWVARAWERLGYATETQYALDRFGMSRSSVRARIRLARKARWLEGLDDAVQRGAVGFEHASLIARVATPDTLDAWVERAGRRTFKHLKEEVRLAELIMRGSDYFEAPPGPPGDEEIQALHEIEADILSGAFFERVLGPGAAEEDEQAPVWETPTTVDADGDLVFQRGEHIEEVQAQLQRVLAERGEGAGEGDGVQMSVGAAAGGEVGGEPGREEGDGVQMSVGAAAGDDAGAEGVDGVQMSVGAAVRDDAGVEGVDGVQMSVGAVTADGDPVETAAARVARARAARQEHGSRRRGRAQVSIRVVAREDVALFYRELEAAFVRSGMPGSFLWFLMWTCWETHGPRFSFGNKWKPIFDRDRHQCASPVCEERHSLSNHHLKYRGHGGGDEPSNQILASYFCHFEGEHGGRLKVRGTAERPVWLLGRVPILRVEGREKTELTAP